MSAVITLSKPITAHGEEIAEITLREPIGGDIMEIGQPTLMIPSADGTSVGVEIRASIIGRYVMKLGGIPLPSVKALAPEDFTKCQNAVMGFFTSGDGEA